MVDELKSDVVKTLTEKVKDFEEFARIEMKKWKLADWTYKTNFNTRRLGVCKYREKRLEVSFYCIIKSRREAENTILHEIAHALTPGHNHDNTWRDIARVVGCTGERCGTAMKVPPRYKSTACFCGTVHTRQRKPAPGRYRCRRCHGLITYTYCGK